MKRTLQPSFAFSAEGLAQFASQVSALLDRPRASVRFSLGGEVTDTRRVTMQVIGRNGQTAAPGLDHAENPTSNRFAVWVRIGTAEWGPAAGTQAVTLVTGTIVVALVVDQLYLIETNASGVAAIDIAVTGAGTRYVTATIDEESASSGAIAWA